jgi:drug/metabolite transporter (DMT)-like permease
MSSRPIPYPYWRANLLLTLTAAIWGFAFVAQRAGMEHVQPFTFNAIRFAIGGLFLWPFLIYLDRQRHPVGRVANPPYSRRTLLIGGLLAGVVLFAAATLQQMGLVYTTAGKAGFITGLYVILVPLLALGLGHRTSAATWIGAILAMIGLYFLSVTGDFTIDPGDLLVLAGAFLWATHILVLGHFSPRISRPTGTTRLALIQFMTCALLSLFAALISETITLDAINLALLPILYAGVMSVGVGYTLQVFSQHQARPSHAAIILSLESVFAVIAGWLLLGEQLSWRGLLGCGLMLVGIMVSQVNPIEST